MRILRLNLLSFCTDRVKTAAIATTISRQSFQAKRSTFQKANPIVYFIKNEMKKWENEMAYTNEGENINTNIKWSK